MLPRMLVASVLLLAGCANRNKVPVIEPVRVEGEQVQVDASQVQAATAASIVKTVQTACEGRCDTVYVDAELSVAPDVLFKLLAAAAPLEGLRVYVLPPSAKRLELDLDTAEPCVAEIASEAGGLRVWRERISVRPDPRCAKWDVAVCRGEDGELDLPRLRSLLGDPKHICLAPGDADLSDLVAIHAALRRPVVRLVSAKVAAGGVSPGALAATVKRHGSDLQWCLDGEVVDEPAPASLQVRLVVHADGHVSRAEALSSKRGGAQFEECVLDVMRKKFTFERLAEAEPAVVEIALEFEPGALRPRVTAPPN